MSAAPRAFADPKADAKQHIDKATAAHSAGQFDEALKELTLAYALDPNPELLFAIGQVHMKIGDCSAATTFYERFIATKPDAKEAAIAQKAITSCKDHPREPEQQEPPPPPKHDDDEQKDKDTEKHAEDREQLPPPPPPTGRPWYADAIGDVLVGLGVVGGGVAVFEYSKAVSSRNAADTAKNYGAYQADLDDAHKKQNLAIYIGAGAGALAAAGLIHYLLAGGPAEEPAPVTIAPVHGGQVVTWTVRF